MKPGDLTAILGGSGAGKSSLMTALAYRTSRKLYVHKQSNLILQIYCLFYVLAGIIVHGDIRVNGRPVDPQYMKYHSGFMHQEDIFIGTMTVLEHLWFMVYSIFYNPMVV